MATTRGLLLAAAVVALAAWAACGVPLHHQAAALHDHPLLGQLGSLNQVQPHGTRQLREALAWPENSEDLPMHAKLRHWMRALDQRLHKYRSPDNGIHGGFFEWLPAFTAAAIPHQAAVSWSTRCYSSNTARVVAYTSLGAEIEITVAEPTGSSACQQNEDFYAVITMEGIHFLHVTKPETHRILWSGKEWTDADKTWIARHGFRFFLFPGTVSQTITQLADTVSLFVPALMEQTVSPDAEKRNVEFLSQSINYTMEKREVTDVFLDESLLNDGDFLGIMRLDGLDTMLAWAMGAHTGHTAITLRIDGELYVCESTVNDSYWPTNGVQRTPYARWFKQAKAAGHVVVHLPLSPESRQLFNSTAAVEFFKTVEGLPYGYHNMLFAWVDTVNDNYPAPLVAELHELLAGLFDRVDRTMATSFWGMAFNKRLNTENLTVIEAINAGDEKGLPFPQLMALPEQDAWSYTDGKSLVCDVLVCEMWKAAGLLGDLADQVQCTEFTNWDAYSLNVFDANYVRPAACVAADPDSQFCQLLGNYRMTLPGYNSRPIRPHMAENCPRGLPPNFDKPDGC